MKSAPTSALAHRTPKDSSTITVGRPKGSSAEAIPFVCIVMSAGGLTPAKLILRQVSPETGLAFVVIHHLHGGPTRLPQILSLHTAMPVQEARGGRPVLANHVYILPPGMEITLVDGVFSVQPRTKSTGWSNVMTVFLNSMAWSRHPGIAITLSGLDGDGAEALKAFKAHGGITIAQAPETAEMPEKPEKPDLPLAWINTGLVDFVLKPGFIAKQLEEYAREHQLAW